MDIGDVRSACSSPSVSRDVEFIGTVMVSVASNSNFVPAAPKATAERCLTDLTSIRRRMFFVPPKPEIDNFSYGYRGDNTAVPVISILKIIEGLAIRLVCPCLCQIASGLFVRSSSGQYTRRRSDRPQRPSCRRRHSLPEPVYQFQCPN